MTALLRLVGVYDADHTLRGELAYFIGARLGRAHCALCDITHGRVRERDEWKACRSEFPVPFDTYHRDNQPDAVRLTIGPELPAVVGETDNGVFLLLGPSELEACAGSVDALRTAVDTALAGFGLTVA